MNITDKNCTCTHKEKIIHELYIYTATVYHRQINKKNLLTFSVLINTESGDKAVLHQIMSKLLQLGSLIDFGLLTMRASHLKICRYMCTTCYFSNTCMCLTLKKNKSIDPESFQDMLSQFTTKLWSLTWQPYLEYRVL